MPGSRFWNKYDAVSSAMVDRVTDVPTFWIVMTTPGINAPDESLIVPRMVPNVDWAKDTTPLRVKIRIKRTARPARDER